MTASRCSGPCAVAPCRYRRARADHLSALCRRHIHGGCALPLRAGCTRITSRRPTSSASGCRRSVSRRSGMATIAPRSAPAAPGERRLKELVKHYGIDVIKEFIEAWMDYGERRAIDAIKQLPGGAISYEVRHDPVPGVADEGVPIKAKVTIDNKKGLITVDVRDNPDCVPGGLNVTEACVIASCRTGVYYNIDSSIPAQPRQRQPDRAAAARQLRGRSAAASDRHVLRHQQRQRASGQCRTVLLRAARQALRHGGRWRQRLGGARRRLRHRQAAQRGGCPM